LALMLCVSTGTAMDHSFDGLWMAAYSALFTVFFLAGPAWSGESLAGWHRPFKTVGALGGIVLALIFSFEGVWKHVDWNWKEIPRMARVAPTGTLADFVVTAGLLAGAIYLFVRCLRRRRGSEAFFGAAPILTTLCLVYSGWLQRENGFPPMILFNLYMFTLSVGILAQGIRRNSLATVNAGMLALTALIAARFFDRDIGFTLRGVLFICIGIGFLTVNAVLIRRRGGVA
jgi:hypothetical protein